MRRAAVAAVLVLAAGWLVSFLVPPWDDESVTDLPGTALRAERFLDGDLPYRDVAFEYPPLAWPVVALGGIGGTDVDDFRVGLGVVMLVFAVAVVLLCGRLAEATGGDPRRTMFAAALLPLLLGAVARTHFDLAAVALMLAALLVLARGSPVLGCALLAAAAATKGFPIVAAPVVLAWLWARGGWAEAGRGLAALVVTGGAIALGAVALSADGAYDALDYQLDRPAQVESSQALVLRALDGETVLSHGSVGVSAGAEDLVSALFLGALCAVVGMLALAAASRPADPRRLVLGSLAAVAAYAAFAEVLSPQFVTWVIPLGALAVGWRAWPLAAAVGAASLLTLAEFPHLYLDAIDEEPFALAVLAARNLALVAVVGLALAEVSRPEREAARSTWPGPDRQPRSEPRSPTGSPPPSRSGRASA